MTLTGKALRAPVGTAGLDLLRESLVELTERDLDRYLRDCSSLERAIVERAIRRPQLLPHQRPPHGQWRKWLLLAGRGAGKSLASCVWFDQHMTGPPCDERIPGGHQALIVAPTQGDATLSCVEGPSGLKVLNPDVRSVTTTGGSHVFWPNGARALMLGAHTPDDLDRFRSAGNRCAVWAEELAAWRCAEKAWEIMDFSVRTTSDAAPLIVASTTPKPRPIIKEWLADPLVAISRASMIDNPHLNEERRNELLAKYEGTRIGRQELHGELVEDVEGALWTISNLDTHRVWNVPCDVRRKVIGVDPTGGMAEVGIVAACIGDDKRIYVTGDYSMERPSPSEWGARVVHAYHMESADRIAVERNYGGDMVKHVLRTTPGGEVLPCKEVNASRGKAVRAEPIANLFEQGRAVLVGSFPDLESQLTTWVPDDNQASPDRMDALVWAITELLPDLTRRPASSGARQILAARIDP